MLRKATTEDLVEIAKIHIESYQNHFLPKLGLHLLSNYYKEFMTVEDILLVYVNENNEINGSLIGTPSSAIGRRRFVKNNWKRLSMRILFLCLILDKQTWERVRKYICRNIRKSRNKREKTDDIPREMTWLSLCVSDKCKGKGIAQLLTQEFEKQLIEAGYKGYIFTVHKDNERTIRFHQKMGRLYYKETKTEYLYRKDLETVFVN